MSYGNPNIPPLELTFDWLFDRISQEDVYIKYFGFCEIGKKHCNPLRKDNKPDCSFYWHQGILFFKDFADGKAYTCVSVVMEVERLSYQQALKKIYEVFLKGKPISRITIVDRPKKDKEYKIIDVTIQPFTSTDISYLKQYGITSELCKQYKVYSIKYYWVNGKISYAYNNYNPCIGYYIDGKWKLYHYKSEDFRFVSNTPHNELQGYNELDWVGDLCVITKSMKDVMLYRKFGINAVAPHGETVSEWIDKIPILQRRFERVVINFDNDKAGIKATNKVLESYNLEVFYVPDEKDLTDYYKKYGYEKTLYVLQQAGWR